MRLSRCSTHNDDRNIRGLKIVVKITPQPTMLLASNERNAKEETRSRQSTGHSGGADGACGAHAHNEHVATNSETLNKFFFTVCYIHININMTTDITFCEIDHV